MPVLKRNAGPAPRRDRESFQERERAPDLGTYRDDMPAEPAPARDLRRVRFGRFVERGLAAGKARGMTVPQIEAATQVGKTTFYRWVKGEWSKDPRTSEVRAFCQGLGLSITEAYQALGWSERETEKPRNPEPIITDPDLRRVMRTLNDPNVSPMDKLRIRRMLRALAADVESSEQ